MTEAQATPATEGVEELKAIESGIHFGTTVNVPDQFVETMREGLTAATVHNNVQEAVLTGTGVTALDKDVQVHDLEKYLPHRRRARGCMTSAYIAPFAQYATAYHETGAVVFVDAEKMTATAVLDLGTKESPGHCSNLAVLKPTKVAAYAALLNINGVPRGQREVAEFFEDWGALAQMKFFTADGEVTPGQALAAVRRITIENLRKVDTEDQQLSASRTAFEAVKASSVEPIPTTIYFTTKPYADLAERTFVLRLGILTSGDKPTMVLRIQNLERHTEEMGAELAGLVQEAITGAMPVLQGSYQKAE